MKKKYFLADMTRVEVEDMLRKVEVGIIKTGRIEQNGPNLLLSQVNQASLYSE